VGRQAELAVLHRALERASTGHGQIVALIGEPGVGKTRLCYELIQSRRARGWLVLESHAVSYGKATPYLPILDLLKGYFQIEDRDEERKIREKIIGRLVTLDTALGPMLPVFLTLLDIPVEDPQWQTLEPLQRRQQTKVRSRRPFPYLNGAWDFARSGRSRGGSLSSPHSWAMRTRCPGK
jgi:predicted ATPase